MIALTNFLTAFVRAWSSDVPLDVSVYVERATVDVDALARVLVLQVHPHCLLRIETHCSLSSQISCRSEDTLVLNVPLEVLDQLLDCLDDVLTFGIFSEFPKVIVLLSLVIGATFAGMCAGGVVPASLQFDDVLLNSDDLCTEKIKPQCWLPRPRSWRLSPRI